MMPSCFVYILPICVCTALYLVLLICKQWLKGKEAVGISVFPLSFYAFICSMSIRLMHGTNKKKKIRWVSGLSGFPMMSQPASLIQSHPCSKGECGSVSTSASPGGDATCFPEAHSQFCWWDFTSAGILCSGHLKHFMTV